MLDVTRVSIALVLMLAFLAPSAMPAAVTQAAEAPPSFGPNGRIAFSREYDGGLSERIYTMTDAGEDVRTVTSPLPGSFDFSPAYSGDGRRLAFIRFSSIGQRTVNVTYADGGTDGGAVWEVVGLPAGQTWRTLSWSPDDKYLAVGSYQKIVVYEFSSKTVVRQYDEAATFSLNGPLRWAIDSNRLLFVAWHTPPGQSTVQAPKIMDIISGSIHVVPSYNSGPDLQRIDSADWSRTQNAGGSYDHNSIYVINVVAVVPGSESTIFEVNFNGTVARTILRDSLAFRAQVNTSPDGEYLTYMQQPRNIPQSVVLIAKLHLRSGVASNLTSRLGTFHHDFSPSWQPGRRTLCKSTVTTIDICQIQVGDVLFIHADWGNIGNEIARIITWNYYTHMAIYVGNGFFVQGYDKNQKNTVTTAREIRTEHFLDSEFNTNDKIKNWLLIRPTATSEQKRKAATQAQIWADKGDAVIGGDVVPYGTSKFAARNDETSTYCSKLVWLAYNLQQVDIYTGIGSIFPTTYLSVIPNPILGGFVDSQMVLPDRIANGWLVGKATRVAYKHLGIEDTSQVIEGIVGGILSPAHILLTDPEGRKTGYDPATGQVLRQIPGVQYSGIGVDPEYYAVADAETAVTVSVTGYASGSYRLISDGVTETGPVSTTIQGSTTPGKTDVYWHSPVDPGKLLPPVTCSPRPRITSSVQPLDENRLLVNVSTTTNPGGSTNRLRSIQVRPNSTGTLEYNSQSYAPNAVVQFTGGRTSDQFIVKRSPGTAVTTQVLIVDDCGVWPSFYGGGANSFRTWARKTGSSSPPRVAMTAVWEDTGGYVLYFGGMSSDYPGDVLVHRPGTALWWQWTSLNVQPAGRRDHTAAWDPVSRRMFIFGGYNGGGHLSDLWSYNVQASQGAGTWMSYSPSGSKPSARAAHAAVWDTQSAQMLMFGGHDGQFLGDLWAYRPASNTWTRIVASTGSPGPRAHHSAVWDPVGNRMLVIGGENAFARLTAVWAYTPATNSWATLASLPTPLAGHSAVWDTLNARILVFGGIGASGAPTNDLYSYRANENSWARVSVTSALPPSRDNHAAVWVPSTNEMLIFDGSSASAFLSDLWSFR